jgi:hypothetical protein
VGMRIEWRKMTSKDGIEERPGLHRLQSSREERETETKSAASD